MGDYMFKNNVIRPGLLFLCMTAVFFIVTFDECNANESYEQWNVTRGESDYHDDGYSIRETSDNKYVLTGYDGNEEDCPVLKMDTEGNTEYYYAYGPSSGKDRGLCIRLLDDGYIVSGYTTSYSDSGYDVLLFKTATNGQLLWIESYGTDESDAGLFVEPTSDDGYLIVGQTYAGKTAFYDSDMYIIKTDANGNEQWNKQYGSDSVDNGVAAIEVSDGYVIVGRYGDGKDQSTDIWLIKIDDSGNKKWEKTYGGSGSEKAYSIISTPDNGYLITGYTSSMGSGGDDGYLIKTDGSGNKLWEKTYGGSDDDWCESVNLSWWDENYVLTGTTNSYGNGGQDLWFLKVDGKGNLIRSETFGGKLDENGHHIQSTSDGCYLIAGETESLGNGDDYSSDIWIIKTKQEDISPPIPVSKNSSYSHDNATLSIEFNEDIDLDSVDASKFILINSKDQANRIDLDMNEYSQAGSHDNRIKFILSKDKKNVISAWGRNVDTFIIELNNGSIADKNGNNIRKTIQRTITTWNKDQIAPYILTTDPANSSVNVSYKKMIIVTFSELMDNDSIITGMDISPQTLIDIEIISSATTGTEISITPRSTLLPNTEYTVGLSGAFDLAGLSLINGSDFQFTTEEDRVPPSIVHNPVSSVKEGSPISIIASFTDEGYGIIQASLYYAALGDSNYTSLEFIHDTGDFYHVDIPVVGSEVRGINYYITVTDGVFIITAPSNVNEPYSIEITPNNNDKPGGNNDVKPGDDESDTPGFSTAIIIASITVTILYRKRTKP